VSNLKEIKELLKKAIATNDQDLIRLANQLLEAEGAKDKKSDSRPTSASPGESRYGSSDFVASIVSDEAVKDKYGGTPVNEVKDRSNSFYDDGTIADDIKTPTFKPTERKRTPYKAIEQKCKRCDKVSQVNPVHKRDHFVCDKCLIK
jgi:hypothetical protein